jgi:hypothetical protein
MLKVFDENKVWTLEIALRSSGGVVNASGASRWCVGTTTTLPESLGGDCDARSSSLIS